MYIYISFVLFEFVYIVYSDFICTYFFNSRMAVTSSGGHLGGFKDILSDRKYCREHTVIVNVRDNSSVGPEDIIQFFHENCGVGSLFACVPKPGICMKSQLMGKPLYTVPLKRDKNRSTNICMS